MERAAQVPAVAALRGHWPEYAMEALGLGLFMVSAAVCATALEAPASPLRAALPDATLRRLLMGLAMGLTAFALIHAPWGRRSGAHLNPAVTLGFLRLGRVAPVDAVGYVVAQCIGALVGAATMAALLGAAFTGPPVAAAATVPGAWGAAAAFAGEATIAFTLMATVLACDASPRLRPWTGRIAPALVALFIVVEAPVSGMSMNPARTLGSAVAAGEWTGFWIYCLAPVAGMLAATELHRALARRGGDAGCAKLHHCPAVRCIHCGYEPDDGSCASGNSP